MLCGSDEPISAAEMPGPMGTFSHLLLVSTSMVLPAVWKSVIGAPYAVVMICVCVMELTGGAAAAAGGPYTDGDNGRNGGGDGDGSCGISYCCGGA